MYLLSHGDCGVFEALCTVESCSIVASLVKRMYSLQLITIDAYYSIPHVKPAVVAEAAWSWHRHRGSFNLQACVTTSIFPSTRQRQRHHALASPRAIIRLTQHTLAQSHAHLTHT